jgi:hypothetical protein
MSGPLFRAIKTDQIEEKRQGNYIVLFAAAVRKIPVFVRGLWTEEIRAEKCGGFEIGKSELLYSR